MNTNSVYVKRTFACSADDLFDWFTTPELIVQWFGPKGFSVGKVKNELVEGGSYSIELSKEITSFIIMGEYIQILKPESLNFTYRYSGLASPPPPSIVRILLREVDKENTSLSLVQEFETLSHDMETRTVAWNYMLNRLTELTIHYHK